MVKQAHFNIDPKLVKLLGETYKSTEYALKELVDNAYDADSENVYITMPEFIDQKYHSITISDDGCGMKEQEVRSEYLKIASSRTARKGNRTIKKKRKVKGRKGIGKLAGLMVAEEMQIETIAEGEVTKINLIKSELVKDGDELDKINIPLSKEKTDRKNGTKITLNYLNQRFSLPSIEHMKSILIADYSREEDFSIFINNEIIGIKDLQGEIFDKEIVLNNGEKARLLYSITDKPIKRHGICLRVGNKIVGRPINFFQEDDVIPQKLKKRIFGEIICDALEDDVRSDWSGIIENSNIYKEIIKITKKELSSSLNEIYKQDMHLARQRYNQRLNKELEKLPEYKREFAKEALLKLIIKYFDSKDKEEKVDTLISLVIDTLNKDHYWKVVKHLDEMGESDVFKLSDVLDDFGFTDMTMIASQARNRLKYLDKLDLLITDEKTTEEQIHKALEKNLWVLGDELNLISSNKTLKKTIKEWLDKDFTGSRANKRPDLFLGSNVSHDYILIEFKKPNVTLNRDHEFQVLKYKEDLILYASDKPYNCYVIGGKINPKIDQSNSQVKYLTYQDVISKARYQLQWLVENYI